MKFISFNVNGIRASNPKGHLSKMIETEKPDILCLQEIRCNDATATKELSRYKECYPYIYFNTSKERKGYSGTAVLLKAEPKEVTYDIPGHANNEGRVITVDLDSVYLVNVYTPNSGEGLKRIDYRINEWDKAFKLYLAHLQTIKPIIVCGDLNVAHTPLDIYRDPGPSQEVAGYTKQERDSFHAILKDLQLVDTFRYMHPSTKKFTFWSNLIRIKAKNDPTKVMAARDLGLGWRIDYFLVSKPLKGDVKSSDVLLDVMGSDHAPVVMQIKTNK